MLQRSNESTSYHFINIKKTNLYYFILVLLAIMSPLTYYPRIYGVDGFELMWMANALRDGALFSENTWLIHPTSYFGYYPFSHRAIGVPFFFAFLISLLSFLSFGIFGITEAILVLDIILIIIIYKCSRNLGNTLFEEGWSRFIFTAAILLAPDILHEVTMIVSARIIITIVMIVLLNMNLKIFTHDKNNKFKTAIFMFLLLLVGALTHRLWIGTLITIIIMIYIVIIRRYKTLQKLTVFLILPITLIAFFVGVGFFGIMPRYGLDNPKLFELIIFVSNYYVWSFGLISIFFPVGVIITLYKLTTLLKKTDENRAQLNNKNQQFLRKNVYLILFIIPFFFLLPNVFYTVILFLPIIIIISVNGLIYIKNFISIFSKKLDWIFPIIILFLLIVSYIVRIEIFDQTKIDPWYVFLFSLIALTLFLLSFIVNNHKKLYFSRSSFDPIILKKGIWIIALTISIFAFSTTSVQTDRFSRSSSHYPWENRYLTVEEIEIIDYFQNEDIDGLIFVCDKYISLRIAGLGFLPAFNGRSLIGDNLWYGVISPNEVYEGTEFSFSFSNLFSQQFFTFRPKDAYYLYESHPLEVLNVNIRNLNVTIPEERELLRSNYNVQYIISVNNTYSHYTRDWRLFRSLEQSELQPVFSTQHLLVWKI